MSRHCKIGQVSLLAVVITVIASLYATPVMALEFDFIERFENGWPKKTRISGNIQKGDYDKFIEFVRRQPKAAFIGLAVIEFSSNGGDVAEAMRIAVKLKQFYPSVFVKGSCASSCSLLWLAGASRHAITSGGGRVGLHRPTLSAEELRKTPVAVLDDRFKKFNRTFKDFVLEQGLPSTLYDRLLATGSTEMYWLSEADLDLIGISPPYFAEKVNAICGREFERYRASASEADMRIYNECYYGIARKERIAAVDSILGKTIDHEWENAKKLLQ